ncbi:hypothetical protein DKX15_16405, partial [Enterococcus faecium]
DLGVGAGERQRAVVVADVGDRGAGDRYGLRPRRIVTNGVDPAVVEDVVGGCGVGGGVLYARAAGIRCARGRGGRGDRQHRGRAQHRPAAGLRSVR